MKIGEANAKNTENSSKRNKFLTVSKQFKEALGQKRSALHASIYFSHNWTTMYLKQLTKPTCSYKSSKVTT